MDEEPALWEPLSEFLANHPRYHDVFRESTDSLFYMDGPLPRDQRHFVALMAAARHDCEYLQEVHSAEFIRFGGDVAWLTGGLPAAPEKFRRLDTLNRHLAHQPWTVTAAAIVTLTRCPFPDNWSLSELMQGAIILSHIHSLASFVKGCGIISSNPPSPHGVSSGTGAENAEAVTTAPAVSPSQHADENSDPDDDDTDPFAVRPVSEVARLMERMRNLTRPSVPQPKPDDVSRQFERLISADHKGGATAGTSKKSPQRSPPAVSRPPVTFSAHLEFHYVDFARRENPRLYPTFRIHDCNWEDHGYSIVSQLYGEYCTLIDRKFRLTQSLTYHSIGKNENVDTEPFRTAIWVYIQSLFGIRHDDYDYHQVNVLLSRRLKELIKTVCCFPQRTTESQRQGVMTDFLHSERVHVMLLMSEARQQSELLYFLRAVGRFMTSS